MLKKCKITAAGILFLIISNLNAQPLVQSTFDTGNEGWMVLSTEGYAGYADWSATGGNPGGAIYDTDMDNGGWVFLAPQKFRGNMSAAYGNKLTYDFFTNRPENDTASIALARADGIGIMTTVPIPSQANTWEHREVVFNVSQQWYTFDYFENTIGGLADASQIYNTLASLQYLALGAEFAPGYDNDGTYTYGELVAYDNVTLTIPEPATMVMLSLGSIALFRKKTK